MSSVATPAPPVSGDRRALGAGRTRLLAQSLGGRHFCDQFTREADAWIAELFRRAVEHSERADGAGLALCAVGGYGRRELCPESDLDLALLHDDRIRDIGRIADRLWYPIWDANVPIDYTVRTARQTMEMVKGNLKSALGLLSVRWVAGDFGLAERVAQQARRRWAANPRASLRRLRMALDYRWEQYGDLASLLEPDVKLSRGGLRDIEALQVAALAAPIVSPVLEDSRLTEHGELLLSVRVAMHATTGRRSDVLSLRLQDPVAKRLGFADASELLRHVAAAGQGITSTTAKVWRLIDARLDGPRRRSRERLLGNATQSH